jgi:ribulose bisphosphate carboxylase small subunit
LRSIIRNTTSSHSSVHSSINQVTAVGTSGIDEDQLHQLLSNGFIIGLHFF